MKTLFLYFSTGSCSTCVRVCVFGAVIFKPSLFYEPFFIVFLGILIWLVLFIFILFIGRGLIEVEYTHVQTLKIIGSFFSFFSFFFL